MVWLRGRCAGREDMTGVTSMDERKGLLYKGRRVVKSVPVSALIEDSQGRVVEWAPSPYKLLLRLLNKLDCLL